MSRYKHRENLKLYSLAYAKDHNDVVREIDEVYTKSEMIDEIDDILTESYERYKNYAYEPLKQQMIQQRAGRKVAELFLKQKQNNKESEQ